MTTNSRSIYLLESDDGEWFLGFNRTDGEEESVIRVDDAIQFVRKQDAETFLKFYNENSFKLYDSDTSWQVIEYPM